MEYFSEKGLAACSLACVLCSEDDCPGCKAKNNLECSIYKCSKEKGLDGCYQCSADNCKEEMPQRIRNKAFSRYAHVYGEEALLRRLEENYNNGILYHRPNEYKGDYDILETEEQIMHLIHTGKINPYIKCPIYETEHFLIRLVNEEDAKELLDCYSDVNACPIFNSDNCTSNFIYSSIGEMKDCIKQWVKSYNNEEYVRFSIIDRHLDKVVGTIEMFGTVGKYNASSGILRLDIESKYEETIYQNELFLLCIKEFFDLFIVDSIITKAIPKASIRIKALVKNGFMKYEDSERKNYWESKKIK